VWAGRGVALCKSGQRLGSRKGVDGVVPGYWTGCDVSGGTLYPQSVISDCTFITCAAICSNEPFCFGFWVSSKWCDFYTNSAGAPAKYRNAASCDGEIAFLPSQESDRELYSCPKVSAPTPTPAIATPTAADCSSHQWFNAHKRECADCPDGKDPTDDKSSCEEESAGGLTEIQWTAVGVVLTIMTMFGTVACFWARRYGSCGSSRGEGEGVVGEGVVVGTVGVGVGVGYDE